MDELELRAERVKDAIRRRREAARKAREELKLADEALSQERTRGWFTDIGASALRGAIRGVKASYDALERVSEAIVGRTGDIRLNIGNGRPFIEVLSPTEARERYAGDDALNRTLGAAADAVGAPQTTVGSLTEGLTQFIVGLVGAKKFLKSYDILQRGGKGVAASRALLEGAIASGVAFEGDEKNLANLIEQFPALKNPVTEFLAVDGDDTEAEGRLKNALTDAGGGLLVDGFIHSLRLIRHARRAKKAAAEEPVAPERAEGLAPESPSAEPPVNEKLPELELTLTDEPLKPAEVKVDEAAAMARDARADLLRLETPEEEAARLRPETPEERVRRLEAEAKRLREAANAAAEIAKETADAVAKARAARARAAANAAAEAAKAAREAVRKPFEEQQRAAREAAKQAKQAAKSAPASAEETVRVDPETEARAQKLEAVATKAEIRAAEASAAADASKPPVRMKELSDEQRYALLRGQLGITNEKLNQLREMVKAGKVQPEELGDLIGINPNRIDVSGVQDVEDMVGLLNTISRLFEEAGVKAGFAPQKIADIAKHVQAIGGNYDEAIRLWERTRNLPAFVWAQRLAVHGSAAKLHRLAKKIASGKYEPQDLLDFVEHDRRHALLQIVARGTRAEIGRALRVMREGVEVNEAALKLSNARQMREARKAQEAAAKAKSAAQRIRETAQKKAEAQKARKIADEARQKELEAKKAAREAARAAAKKVSEEAAKAAKQARQQAREAAAKVEAIERAGEKIALDAARKRARELEAKARAAEEAAGRARVLAMKEEPDLDQMVNLARKALDEAHARRMADEVKEARRLERERVRAAERARREAERAAKRAEKEVKAFEDHNAALNDPGPVADVVLEGDLKVQLDEVENALAGMGLRTQDVIRLAEEVAKRETVTGVNAAARTGLWARLQDRISFLYINNILSGLPTMAINIGSGFYKMVESVLERYGAAVLGGDKFDFIAANKAALATFTSWRAAWRLAAKAWSEGLPQTDTLSRIEVAMRGGAGTTLGEKIIAVPSRAILTIDEFFKHIFYQQELAQRAVEVAAAAARLQPDARSQQRMFERVLKETLENPPDDLVLDAIESARYNTFQSTPESSFVNWLIRGTNGTPILKLIVPFVRTPSNIIKQGVLERSPLAALRVKFWKQVLAGGREGRVAIVRAALGTAAVGIVWQWAAEGRVTGSRVGRPGLPNTGDLKGPPPYSIKVPDWVPGIGGQWVQYNRLDPLGTVLGLTADIRALWDARREHNSNDIESDDMDMLQAVTNLLGIVTENITDKTFFKGIADFVQAMEAGASERGTILEAYGNTIFTNLVPLSSLQRNIARAHDGYAREAFTFVERLMAQTPGLSDKLPPKHDILGRPIRYAERLGNDYVSPILIGKDDPDPIARELAALEMNYRMPDKDIAGVDLSAEQYSYLTKVRGQFLYNTLRRWIESGDWARLTRYERINMVRKWMPEATRIAEQSVLAQWPDLARHVLARKEEARAIRAGEIE